MCRYVLKYASYICQRALCKYGILCEDRALASGRQRALQVWYPWEDSLPLRGLSGVSSWLHSNCYFLRSVGTFSSDPKGLISCCLSPSVSVEGFCWHCTCGLKAAPALLLPRVWCCSSHQPQWPKAILLYTQGNYLPCPGIEPGNSSSKARVLPLCYWLRLMFDEQTLVVITHAGIASGSDMCCCWHLSNVGYWVCLLLCYWPRSMFWLLT